MRKNLFGIAILASLLFIGCTDEKEEMIAFAQKDLSAKVSYPKQLKILGVSQPDSAFGDTYYSKSEVEGIMKIMKLVTTSILKRTNNMTNFDPNDYYVMSLASRQMATTEEIRKMVLQSDKKGEFSGWKVKIDYECKDKNGQTYRTERWFFFDKTCKNITRTFELPLP